MRKCVAALDGAEVVLVAFAAAEPQMRFQMRQMRQL